MKDKELAEEYFKNQPHTYADNEEQLKEDIIAAFLAGLKAGRPQWHDLRKDPDDLPKEHISVLVMLEYGVPYISFVLTDKRWFCTDYYTGEDKVIAWCEIPTFDKE